jgi:hypothetical protein
MASAVPVAPPHEIERFGADRDTPRAPARRQVGNAQRDARRLPVEFAYAENIATQDVCHVRREAAGGPHGTSASERANHSTAPNLHAKHLCFAIPLPSVMLRWHVASRQQISDTIMPAGGK